MHDKYAIPREKTAQLIKLLNAQDIDALLIFAREGSDKILPFLTGEDAIHTCAALFCKNGEIIILSSSSDKGKYEQTGIFTEVRDYGTDIKNALGELLGSRDIKKLALNVSSEFNTADWLTQGLYIQLQEIVGVQRLMEIEVSSAPLILELRSKKTVGEIETITKAIEITQDIYEEVFAGITVGMTEKEIGDLFVEGMKKRDVTNGNGEGYEYPIVCFSRAGLAHRGPGDTKSEHGDVLICDFSVRYNGYTSDIARSAYFLKPGETKAPDDIEHVFATAYAAITASIEACKPGTPGFEVDAAGRKVIEEGGYPTVRHSVGHQIGRECHDGGTGLSPRRPSSEGLLAVGECYAIEPTVIQDDGKTCMIVEENVVITEHGAKLLSKRQEKLVYIKP